MADWIRGHFAGYAERERYLDGALGAREWRFRIDRVESDRYAFAVNQSADVLDARWERLPGEKRKRDRVSETDSVALCVR